MIRFAIDTHIDRPVAEVFAYATDPDRLPAWQTNTVSSIREDDGPMGTGSRLREVHRAPGGKRVESVVEVAEYERDRVFALRVREGMPVDLRMTFVPHGQSTAMRFAVDGHATGLLRLAEPLLARVLKRQFTRQCVALKRILEA